MGCFYSAMQWAAVIAKDGSIRVAPHEATVVPLSSYKITKFHGYCANRVVSARNKVEGKKEGSFDKSYDQQLVYRR